MCKMPVQKILVKLFSIDVRMVCLLFFGLSAKLMAEENVPFVFAEGEIIRADEINENYQSLLGRLVELEGRLAELEQDLGIQGKYLGLGAGSRFKSYQDGAFVDQYVESTIWSDVVIAEDLLLYGLRQNQYAKLLNSNPSSELSLSKETDEDGGSNESSGQGLVQLSLISGTGGIGSVYQGEIFGYDEGEAKVISSMMLKMFRATKDVLVYQVQYSADSTTDLADHGLGYEQGVFIRSNDDS